ncbi:MAG: hypothetical protein ABL883_02305 [Terricaulis sp.]
MPERTAAPVAVPHCAEEPLVIDTVTIVPGRTSERDVRRRFGEPAQREPEPSPGSNRWLYHPAMQARYDRDTGAWTIELLNCRPQSRPGLASSLSVEFTFDRRDRVSDVSVSRNVMPILDE